MQIRKLGFLRLGFFIPLVFISFSGMSQTMNSLYFMRGVPQNYQVNPAFQSDFNKFFGIPVLSALNIKVQNSPFALKDVVFYNSEIGSLITFLHPLADKQALLDQLNETNFFNTEFSVNLASIGFRAKKMYFTFDINERALAQLSYPDDFIQLPIFGPDSGRVYDFNNFGLDFSVFNEFSIGISYKYSERLTVGMRAKILLGQANLQTDLFDVKFLRNQNSWLLHSNININSSSPYLSDYIPIVSNAPIDLILGKLDSINIGSPTRKELYNMAINPKNFGLGLDIGADYRITDRLQVSASIIDIGRIKWKSGVVNLTNQADYTFNGMDLLLGGDKDFLQTFSDSLSNTFNQFTTSSTDYSTWLPAKIYVGAAFYVHPKISFGILSRTDFYKGNVKQQFTASANLYPIRLLSTTFSYSIIDKSYKNLGFGLSLNLTPFNLYIISDTGPTAAMWWNEAKYVNLRIGLNLVFGLIKGKGKDQKKTKLDIPLID
jgi:hypothetical protein